MDKSSLLQIVRIRRDVLVVPVHAQAAAIADVTEVVTDTLDNIFVIF